MTAPETEGFTFVGWFAGSYSSDNLKSPDQTYTFTVEENVTLIAVYEAKALTGKLHIRGRGYKVQYANDDPNYDPDLIHTSSEDFVVPIGVQVTLIFTGEDFKYWVNYSNNIVSTEAQFSFVMVSETTISVYTTTVDNPTDVSVIFLNGYNQVLAKQNIADEYDWDDVVPPVIPSRMGHTFDGWYIADENGKPTETEADGQSVMAAGSSIVVIVPKFVTNGQVYTLKVKSVDNGTEADYETYELDAGISKTINALDIADGNGCTGSFQYWMLGENIVSYADSYTVVSVGGKELTLTAVFSDENVDEQPTIAITQVYRTETSDGKHKISFTMSYYLPDGYTVQKSGFVYANDAKLPDDLDDFVVDNPNVYKHIAKVKEETNTVIYTMNMTVTKLDSNVHVRAFVICTDDATGEIVAVYAPTVDPGYVTVTYNSLGQ